MIIALPSCQTPATAREAYRHYKTLDNRSTDNDLRPDFLEFTQQDQKVEMALTPAGFLARQTQSNQVQVVRATIQRWLSKAQVEIICRSNQGAYSGFLAGMDISADPLSQDQARQSFYQWQRPLQKQGDCGG